MFLILKEHFLSFVKRFAAFGDKSAFLLTAPFILALYFIDKALLATLLQWVLFAPVLAGVAIIVSRLTFPNIVLDEHADEARKGNVAAAIVVAAIVFFVAVTMIALVLWAKA